MEACVRETYLTAIMRSHKATIQRKMCEGHFHSQALMPFLLNRVCHLP